MNEAMKKLFDEYQLSKRVNEIRLEPRLVSLLSSGFIELNGCYFLQALLPAGFDIEEAERSAFDRTEIECDINHIHVGDYLDRPEGNIKSLIEQGVRYAFSLRDLLPESADFKVILACTFEPNTDCNIRFHKQRLGEEWLADNLEKYNEALLLLD